MFFRSFFADIDRDDHCPPLASRGLNWSWTKIGEVSIQPCPQGSTGLARWACVQADSASKAASWSGIQPDMSDCKSKALSDLEAQVKLHFLCPWGHVVKRRNMAGFYD